MATIQTTSTHCRPPASLTPSPAAHPPTFADPLPPATSAYVYPWSPVVQLDAGLETTTFEVDYRRDGVRSADYEWRQSVEAVARLARSASAEPDVEMEDEVQIQETKPYPSSRGRQGSVRHAGDDAHENETVCAYAYADVSPGEVDTYAVVHAGHAPEPAHAVRDAGERRVYTGTYTTAEQVRVEGMGIERKMLLNVKEKGVKGTGSKVGSLAGRIRRDLRAWASEERTLDDLLWHGRQFRARHRQVRWEDKNMPSSSAQVQIASA